VVFHEFVPVLLTDVVAVELCYRSINEGCPLVEGHSIPTNDAHVFVLDAVLFNLVDLVAD